MAAPSKFSPHIGKFTSVFAKISGIVAVCGLIFAGALTTLSIDAQHKRVEAATQDTAVEITPMIARQVLGALRFDKKEPATQILETIISDSHEKGLAATLIAADGQDFASHSNGGDLEALNALAREALATAAPATSADGFSYAMPVYVGEGSPPIGAIATQWSPAIAIAESNADMLRIVLITAGIFALCLIGIGGAIYLAVAKPLIRVNSAMSNVAAKDYSTEIPNRNRRDEIGAIANSLEDFRLSLALAQEANFQALLRSSALEASSAPLMMTNNEHEILYTNPAMVRFFQDHVDDFRKSTPNFDPVNTIGLRANTLGASSDAATHQIKNGLKAETRFETRLGAATVIIEIAPIFNAEGEKIGHVAEWRDISVDQRNATVIAAIDATQLRAEFSPQGTLEAANGPFCALMGASNEALSGRSFAKAFKTDAALANIFDTLKVDGEFSGKLVLTLHDGTSAIIDGIFAPVKDTTGDVQRIVLLARDVTAAEERDQRNQVERATLEAAQLSVVDALRNALGALSRGDLTVEIQKSFAPEYEQLRSDFNSAAVNLLTAMRGVLENADAIRSEASEISAASDDLSRRTEQQAATLEETAAALNQLTASVQSAAEVASQANEMVAKAKTNAETSGAVVREAVLAMGEIEESSGKISKITSVIDEIAFQTNLLALNAGVEAARAGEAGRGFAVVASEVRALAQRSSDAAREIAGLISSSTNQVKRGVGLVGQAGDALRGIESSVSDIYTFVSEIAVSAREQSSGLAEINTAVNQLDQVTQQNAAMFEETTAASHSLTREAQSLNDTMSIFNLGASDQPARIVHASQEASVNNSSFKSSRTSGGVASPDIGPSRRLTSLAVKPAADENSWEDF